MQMQALNMGRANDRGSSSSKYGREKERYDCVRRLLVDAGISWISMMRVANSFRTATDRECEAERRRRCEAWEYGGKRERRERNRKENR